MKIGDKVRIVKCNVCPKVINKTAKVTKITIVYCDKSNAGVDGVEVKFGRGRPQKDRPNTFLCDDVALVKED